MTRRAAAALALAGTLAGCGGAAEPARLPELTAEVRAATAALLAAPGFDGTAVRAGEGGAVSRVDWVHWHASGDYRYLTAAQPVPGAPPSVFGLVQVGDDLYSAQGGPQGDEPWASLDEEPTERIPLALDVAGIATGEVPPAAIAPGDADVSRELGPGGEVRWSMSGPHRGDRLDQAWVIGADGVLRSYSVRTAGGAPIQDGTTAVEYSFAPLPDPGAVTAPMIGTPLDPGELGAPADLPLVQS